MNRSSQSRNRGDNTLIQPMSVTLHTDLGDIKIEVDCRNAKKASYNFLALCASGYYDNTLIHRNIKGFMVQMGDPTGTGKGGMPELDQNTAYTRKEHMGQQI